MSTKPLVCIDDMEGYRYNNINERVRNGNHYRLMFQKSIWCWYIHHEYLGSGEKEVVDLLNSCDQPNVGIYGDFLNK